MQIIKHFEPDKKMKINDWHFFHFQNLDESQSFIQSASSYKASWRNVKLDQINGTMFSRHRTGLRHASGNRLG